jgi:hypothetical protein
MTTPIIPEFIVELFANEIYKINIRMVDIICTKYNLNVDDVKQTLEKELKISLTIDPSKTIIKLIKKNKYGSKTTKENRCQGRVYHKDDNEYVQCSRKKFENTSCCKTHNCKQPYGNINDPEPELKEKKKKSIL